MLFSITQYCVLFHEFSGFVRLKTASVLVADYVLLRRDFSAEMGGKTNEEIDLWLLQNAAYLSSGQVGFTCF